MYKIIRLLAAVITSINIALAASFDWNLTSTVSIVEPTYLPNFVRIQLDGNATGVCANKWLDYYGQGAETSANTLAVYSALMTALVSGSQVHVYATNDCIIKYVHLLKAR